MHATHLLDPEPSQVLFDDRASLAVAMQQAVLIAQEPAMMGGTLADAEQQDVAGQSVSDVDLGGMHRHLVAQPLLGPVERPGRGIVHRLGDGPDERLGHAPHEADAVAARAFDRRLMVPGRADPCARLGQQRCPCERAHERTG